MVFDEILLFFLNWLGSGCVTNTSWYKDYIFLLSDDDHWCDVWSLFILTVLFMNVTENTTNTEKPRSKLFFTAFACQMSRQAETWTFWENFWIICFAWIRVSLTTAFFIALKIKIEKIIVNLFLFFLNYYWSINQPILSLLRISHTESRSKS